MSGRWTAGRRGTVAGSGWPDGGRVGRGGRRPAGRGGRRPGWPRVGGGTAARAADGGRVADGSGRPVGWPVWRPARSGVAEIRGDRTYVSHLCVVGTTFCDRNHDQASRGGLGGEVGTLSAELWALGPEAEDSMANCWGRVVRLSVRAGWGGRCCDGEQRRNEPSCAFGPGSRRRRASWASELASTGPLHLARR